MTGPLRTAIIAWAATSVAFLIHAAVTFADPASAEFTVFAGPISSLRLTMLAVTMVWTLLGVVMIAVASGRITPRNMARVVTVVCLALLYINVMRERESYGDVGIYVDAAQSLRAGLPLPSAYIYPPLWATLLSPLVPVGANGMLAVCWVLNLFSLATMIWLLPRVLEKYGLSRELATVIAFLFAVVNVPVLRTLGYVQVNFHVTNLIFLCLLSYPHARALSAAALSAAVHLKISPLVLVLPFVLARDFRWLAWFGVATLGLAMVPVAAFGWSPYQDFMANIIAMSPGDEPAYRNSSIDSFVGAVFGESWGAAPYLIWSLKGLLAGACITIAATHARLTAFVPRAQQEAMLLNMLPALLVLMVMASPLVWEHHPVLMGVSFLVVGTRLSTAGDWTTFGVAYALEFLMPTFDFFPWSYGRLLAPLMLLWLAWSVRHHSPSRAVAIAEGWLRHAVAFRAPRPGQPDNGGQAL